MRVFNNREGFTARDDSLPGRLFEPLVAGPTDKKKIDRATFNKELEIYYRYAV
jgi:aldehyde:ferredoxin oxidoreductase